MDYNAGEACDVAIKVFMCIKIAWERVGNMFATVLTIIATIWRPGIKTILHFRSDEHKTTKKKDELDKFNRSSKTTGLVQIL